MSSGSVARKSGVRPALAVALLVGVEDRVAEICAAAAIDAGIAILRVAHGPAACRAMRESLPDVVVLPPTLWRDEREAISAISHEVGARVLDVPTNAAPAWLALSFVRAATREDEQPRLCG